MKISLGMVTCRLTDGLAFSHPIETSTKTSPRQGVSLYTLGTFFGKWNKSGEKCLPIMVFDGHMSEEKRPETITARPKEEKEKQERHLTLVRFLTREKTGVVTYL